MGGGLCTESGNVKNQGVQESMPFLSVSLVSKSNSLNGNAHIGKMHQSLL